MAHSDVALRSSNKYEPRLFAIILAVVIVCALHFAKVVFVPLALAILFAFVLSPIVTLLERARFGRGLATLLVISVVIAGIGLIGWVITRQFSEVINQLPLYQSNIEEKIRSLHFLHGSTLKNASATVSQINKAVASPTEPATTTRGRKFSPTPAQPVPVQIVPAPALPIDSVQNALEFLLQVLIVIVFTSFMLLQKENLRSRFLSLVERRQMSTLTRAVDEASGSVGRYLQMQLTINVIYGAAIGVGLHFIGIPGALLWGVIVGALRFVPYLGPPLGGIMPVLLSLALFHGWEIPLITFAMFFCVELTASHFVEPMLYGTKTGISSLAILVAAIFWTVLWGPVGLVLSTPLTVCLVVMGRYVSQLNFLSVLLGGEPILAGDALVYQRLLAMDEEGAEEMLEDRLKTEPLIEVCDSVLLPALNMAEHDRHRGQIDDETAALIFQNLREIVDDLFERYKEEGANSGPKGNVTTSALTSTLPLNIVCVPARDEADEVAALMLARLLEQAGHNAACLSICSADEALEQIQIHHADVVFISALPPFVISHSRRLYRAIKTHLPATRSIVGLWTFAGDTSKLAKRIGARGDEAIIVTLMEALTQSVQLPAQESTSQEGTLGLKEAAPPSPRAHPRSEGESFLDRPYREAASRDLSGS